MPCSKGMRTCRSGCLHRRLIGEYQVAREASERLREAATLDYPAERVLYDDEHRRMTLRAWLEGHARDSATREDASRGTSNTR